jgi:hypothetical protein
LSVLSGRGAYEGPGKALRGEDLRRRHERRIAQYLAENGIRYEQETVARGNRRVLGRTSDAPDFYLPDYGIYVEYWGLAHASPDDVQRMRRKMTLYNRHEIKFISLFHEDMDKLGLVFRARFREIAGFELPHSFARADIRFCSICGTPPAPGAKFCAKCVRKLV